MASRARVRPRICVLLRKDSRERLGLGPSGHGGDSIKNDLRRCKLDLGPIPGPTICLRESILRSLFGAAVPTTLESVAQNGYHLLSRVCRTLRAGMRKRRLFPCRDKVLPCGAACG